VNRTILTIPRLLVGAFAVTILAGAVLLWLLPTHDAGAAPLSPVDALFTATSAVCVTGLVVRDTGSELNFLGQFLVILLAQIGGLGILTLSALFLNTRHKKMSLTQRTVMEQTHGVLPYVRPRHLLRQILVYTFGVEAIGFAALVPRFMADRPFLDAVWSAFFHAISAFCNAGFSLYPDSLTRYQDDPYVNLVVIWLIVMGGLGFLVFADIRHFLGCVRRRQRGRLSLHTKIVLWMTVILVVSGAVVVRVFELGGNQVGDNWVATSCRMLFMSAATRTAGFNTIDVGEMRNATLMVFMILMAIGGAPGSTAGGIKTTTAAALVAMLIARIRNRPAPEILGRSLPPDVTAKALATLAGFFVTGIVALLALEWTESSLHSQVEMQARFLSHMFEVVSALGTVGLSMGATPDLSTGGKLIITVCMFLGRLGPLVVGASFIGSTDVVPYKYPEETILIG
jgi:trk system potassium uptake protein TrkH